MRRYLNPALWALLALGRPGFPAEPPRVPGKGPAETGRIEGVATIATSLRTARGRVRVYDEPGTRPAKLERDEHPFASVVLYLETTPALLKAPPQATTRTAPELRQSGERFVPHVVAVVAGTTVQFPNDDPIYHNVFSLSRVKSFDLGRYARGSSRPVTFTRAGVVSVFCHIHADMSGYIVVLDNPFFVMPDDQGHFALEGVPPGDYQLIAWHERIRPVAIAVHVDAGRTTTLPVRIPFPEPGESP